MGKEDFFTLTAYAGDGDQQHLAKPIEPEQLIATNHRIRPHTTGSLGHDRKSNPLILLETKLVDDTEGSNVWNECL